MISSEPFSPTMRAAIDHALLHSNGVIGCAKLYRFPGGFWSDKDWRLYEGPYWGTTTIEAIVKRGAGEYTKCQGRKDGSKFPVEVHITL